MTDGCGEDIPLLPLLPMLMRVVKLADAHKQYGMTKQQMIVLLTLYRRDCATMGEIAQFISASKEQATRVVASMCDQGLVERFELPENRTHVYIRFTGQGRDYMRQIGRTLGAEIRDRLTASLTPDEIEQLRGSVRSAVELLGKVK